MDYIACFGDSLVQGFPYGTSSSWVAKAEALSLGQLKLYNYGLCGDCCDDIFYRMRIRPIPPEVRYILFLGGANDSLQNCPYEYTMDSFAKMVKWSEDNNYKLGIILPFISTEEFYNRKLLNYRQDLIHKYQNTHVRLFDLQTAIGKNQQEISKAYLDGFHPHLHIYEALGELILPQLLKWVKNNNYQGQKAKK